LFPVLLPFAVAGARDATLLAGVEAASILLRYAFTVCVLLPLLLVV
jgi:hypothetical protein